MRWRLLQITTTVQTQRIKDPVVPSPNEYINTKIPEPWNQGTLLRESDCKPENQEICFESESPRNEGEVLLIIVQQYDGINNTQTKISSIVTLT